MSIQMPTDEQMRAEVPAIARPYVAERDKAIAKLESQLKYSHKALESSNQGYRLAVEARNEHYRRHEGWLIIVDTIDDPAEAIATFMEWRGAGYDGDPLRFRAPEKTAAPMSPPVEAHDQPGAVTLSYATGEITTKCSKCGQHVPSKSVINIPEIGYLCSPCVWAMMEEEDTSPVADGPIATRFDAAADCPACNDDGDTGQGCGCIVTPPRTVGDHLHAAQLATRAHVVPHIRAASEAATAEGDPDLAAACTFFAALVNGDLDPAILRYGAALLRFVEGKAGA